MNLTCILEVFSNFYHLLLFCHMATLFFMNFLYQKHGEIIAFTAFEWCIKGQSLHAKYDLYKSFCD